MIFENQYSEIFIQKYSNIRIMFGFENCHELNTNNNIRWKIFEYLNIFEYSFIHWLEPNSLPKWSPAIKSIWICTYYALHCSPIHSSLIFKWNFWKYWWRCMLCVTILRPVIITLERSKVILLTNPGIWWM